MSAQTSLGAYSAGTEDESNTTENAEDADDARYEVRVGTEDQVESYPDDLPVRHRTDDLDDARRAAMRYGRIEDLPARVWDVQTGERVPRDSSSDEDDGDDDGEEAESVPVDVDHVSKKTCQRCGNRVSRDFGRVFGDRDDVVHACQDCATNEEIGRGAAADPNFYCDIVTDGGTDTFNDDIPFGGDADGSEGPKSKFDDPDLFPTGVTDLPVVVETESEDLSWAYEALELTPGATEVEIRSAYRRLVKDVHPDQGGDEDEFKRLTRAKNVLTGNDRAADGGDPTAESDSDEEPESGSGGVGDFQGDDFAYSWEQIQRMYAMTPKDMRESFKDAYVRTPSQVKNYARQFAVEKIVTEHDIMTVVDERKDDDDEDSKRAEALLLYHDDTGVYEGGAHRDLKSIIKRGIGRQNTKDSEIREIIKGIRAETYVPREETNGMQFDDDYLCVGNGVINLTEARQKDSVDEIKLYDHAPDYRFTVGIEADFDADADRTTAEKFLTDITRREADKQVLCEIAGECLLPHYEHAWFAIMFGPGGNGKTTFANWLKAMLGSTNTTGISLQKIANNRFSSSRMHDKMANIFPDIPETQIKDLSAIKARTGGDEVEEEGKGTDGYDAVNRAKQIFGVNNAVKLGDASDAVKRRIVPLYLPNKFTSDPEEDNPHEKQKDTSLGDELKESENLSALLNLALEGLMRVEENDNDFSLPESEDERWEFYESFSDPIMTFRHECLKNEYPDDPKQTDPSVWMTPEEIYQTWQSYRVAKDHPKKSRNNVFFPTLHKSSLTLEDYWPEDSSTGNQIRAYRDVTLTEAGWEHAPENLRRRVGNIGDGDKEDDGEDTDAGAEEPEDLSAKVTNAIIQLGNSNASGASLAQIMNRVGGDGVEVSDVKTELFDGVHDGEIEMDDDGRFLVATEGGDE